MSKERELLQRIVKADIADYIDIIKEAEELLAQPKQGPESFKPDWVSYRQGVADSKREPLSEDKLDVLAEANITDEGIAGYYLGFRDAEKAHGIGGGD